MPSKGIIPLVVLCILGATVPATAQSDVWDRVEHHYADNEGVRIHYATLGTGPLVVMLHGFPDFWYTWRHQMAALSERFTVAAVDLRGYNRSDKPTGVEQYAVPALIGDVGAVIRDMGEESAVVVGHDWGALIAWQVAIHAPQLVDKLVILSVPHPVGLTRELAENPEQYANSQYARNFQEEGAHEGFTAEGLAGWVRDPVAKARYVEAFDRSDFEAMLNYYKANYPRVEPGTVPGMPDLPKVQAPVLILHGLDDIYLMPGGFDGTWQWIDGDLTQVALPGVGHFIQQDAEDLVTRSMVMWLGR